MRDAAGRHREKIKDATDSGKGAQLCDETAAAPTGGTANQGARRRRVRAARLDAAWRAGDLGPAG
jgi:hypothetical protein